MVPHTKKHFRLLGQDEVVLDTMFFNKVCFSHQYLPNEPAYKSLFQLWLFSYSVPTHRTRAKTNNRLRGGGGGGGAKTARKCLKLFMKTFGATEHSWKIGHLATQKKLFLETPYVWCSWSLNFSYSYSYCRNPWKWRWQLWFDGTI